MTAGLLFGALLSATLWTLLGLVAVARTARRRPRGGAPLPSVTLLKPLAGADPSLAQNLRTAFEQTHPSFEIVLGVESEDDPAYPIAAQAMARYPAVASRLVVTGRGDAKNPKVRNLLGILPQARHDLCVISDSNVRVAPDYLEDLVATREREGAGLVTSLVAGVGEASIGAAADSAHLNGFSTPGSCLPTSFGSAAIVGKSILFSQRELESLGGLRKVADVLAEDFVLGKMYEHAGMRLAIGSTIVENVTGRVTLGAFFARQRRWAALRYRLAPVSLLLELLVSPLAIALVALVMLSWPRALEVAASAWLLAIARDVGGWALLRGPRRAWVPFVVGPVKDALALAALLTAPFARTLHWRGRSLRLGAGTILYTANIGYGAGTSDAKSVAIDAGIGAGRRASRSTNTWTKWPSATLVSARATNTPSS